MSVMSQVKVRVGEGEVRILIEGSYSEPIVAAPVPNVFET